MRTSSYSSSEACESPPRGGRAANQIGATAPLSIARSRWSLHFVKKSTILEVSSTKDAVAHVAVSAGRRGMIDTTLELQGPRDESSAKTGVEMPVGPEAGFLR